MFKKKSKVAWQCHIKYRMPIKRLKIIKIKTTWKISGDTGTASMKSYVSMLHLCLKGVPRLYTGKSRDVSAIDSETTASDICTGDIEHLSLNLGKTSQKIDQRSKCKR